MAKRNYSVMKRSKRVEPAHLRFSVPLTTLTSETASANEYLDLSQIASILNRRFYRQGLNWAVGSIKHLATTSDDSSVSGFVSIGKLPETWVMKNAWTKGFKAWQKMNNEALAESQSVKPKFLDFKIYADSDHHQAGFDANLLPFAANGVLYNAGEWQPSKFVIPSAGSGVITREILATGPSYPGAGASTFDAVSLIEGYASSRALPQPEVPHTPADAEDASGLTPENWLAALFNQGIAQDEEVLEDMITENNQAPYPFEDDGTNLDTMYPGGANQAPGLVEHDFQYITGTTVGGHTYLAPGCFPCGLMKIQTSATLPPGVQLFQGLWIELVPGDHRGYMAESMA
jgi:hypothetical protein